MAAKKKNFRTIIESQIRKGSVPQDVYESREWYREKAIRTRNLRGVNSQRILKIGRDNQRMRPTLKGMLMLGKMFMFEYEAKGADTMPYYDNFPIVRGWHHRIFNFYGGKEETEKEARKIMEYGTSLREIKSPQKKTDPAL